MKLKDSEIIVDKYEIMTNEKEYSLGETHTIKELCDMWGNCVKIYDKASYVGYCYKTCNNQYDFSFASGEELWGKPSKNKELKKGLSKVVRADECGESDLDGYPTICAYME